MSSQRGRPKGRATKSMRFEMRMDQTTKLQLEEVSIATGIRYSDLINAMISFLSTVINNSEALDVMLPVLKGERHEYLKTVESLYAISEIQKATDAQLSYVSKITGKSKSDILKQIIQDEYSQRTKQFETNRTTDLRLKYISEKTGEPKALVLDRLVSAEYSRCTE